MKLYLLKSIPIVDFDCNEGFIIRAKSPKQARKLANERIGDEGLESKDFWFDKKFSSCKILKFDGTEEIVLQSYKNG